MAGLSALGEQSCPSGAAYTAIEYWACSSSGVQAVVPPDVVEATAAAPARAPGRFEAAAMMDARHLAAASGHARADLLAASLDATNCRAGDHPGASPAAPSFLATAAGRLAASLGAGPDHDALRASRRASTRAGRCVAERHRFGAGQVGASPAAASCRVTADRPGASHGRPPAGAALRVARRASTRADRHGASRHRTAFHCAKAPHRAADCYFPCRVRLRVQIECGLSLLAPLTLSTPGGAAAALRRAPAACNRACAKDARSVRLERAWALTGSDHRLA
jgi:hypothetical protein